MTRVSTGKDERALTPAFSPEEREPVSPRAGVSAVDCFAFGFWHVVAEQILLADVGLTISSCRCEKIHCEWAHLDPTTQVGRSCRSAQTSARTSAVMFLAGIAARIALLAVGKVRAERQLRPTLEGGCVKMRPLDA